MSYFRGAATLFYGGGSGVAILLLFSFILGQSLRVLLDWWLAYWISNVTLPYERLWNYWGLWFIVIGILTLLVTIFRSWLVVLIAVRSCYSLHDTLFTKVLT